MINFIGSEIITKLDRSSMVALNLEDHKSIQKDEAAKTVSVF